MNTSQADVPGLRERKKQQTREALSWAALRLAIDRGLGNVLVEDIAAEAGVSPRTFNNYFSSKAEAITWRHLNRARRTADLPVTSAPPPTWSGSPASGSCSANRNCRVSS
jgi:AcrR family transcriptional regulator